MKMVVQGDARRLPFRAGTFGSILGICVVEHLLDIDTCLTEAARVLRPGGTLIATVPSSHWKALYFWNSVLSTLGFPKLGRRIVDAHDQRMAHRNLFGPVEWTRRFREAGFEPIAFDPFLAPRTAWFVTFLESIFEQPFPFPGFWTSDGTFYFMSGV
jgi:ubiquinone/menaquinone biosynthesis C-methylase UbiE